METSKETTKLKTFKFQLKTLEEQRAELQSKLFQNKKDIFDKRGEFFTAEYGLKPGDIIEVKGEKYEFTAIDSHCSMDWIRGHKLKKDGTPGKREQIIWNWRK